MEKEVVKRFKGILIMVVFDEICLEDGFKLPLLRQINPLHLSNGVEDFRRGNGDSRRPADLGELDNCRYHSHGYAVFLS